MRTAPVASRYRPGCPCPVLARAFGYILLLLRRGRWSECAGLLPLCCAAGAQVSLPEAPLPPAATTGTSAVRGQVLSDDGAIISGAHIALNGPSLSKPLQATSDAEGEFVLGSLPAGPYRLSVTLPGFTSFEQNVELGPGQTLELAPVELSMAAVSITVDAVTPEQMALEQLHAQEQQRLVGILPNFYVSYNWTAPPMTAGQKFRLATKNVLDPGNLALVGTVAGVQQATNAFPGYGQGAAGYGRRYGADLGNLVVGSYLGGAVLPSLFHQDPRYYFKGTGTIRSRALYAISRAVVTRGDNGKNQPNFSGVLGDLSAGAISNVYYDSSDRQGAKLFLENGLLAIAGDAMNGLVQEFLLPRLTTRGKKKDKSGASPANATTNSSATELPNP